MRMRSSLMNTITSNPISEKSSVNSDSRLKNFIENSFGKAKNSLNQEFDIFDSIDDTFYWSMHLKYMNDYISFFNLPNIDQWECPKPNREVNEFGYFYPHFAMCITLDGLFILQGITKQDIRGSGIYNSVINPSMLYDIFDNYYKRTGFLFANVKEVRITWKAFFSHLDKKPIKSTDIYPPSRSWVHFHIVEQDEKEHIKFVELSPNLTDQLIVNLKKRNIDYSEEIEWGPDRI